MARQFTKGIDIVKDTTRFFDESMVNAREGHAHLALSTETDWKELVSGDLTKSQTRGAFARGSSPATSTPSGRRRTLSPRQLANRNIPGGVPSLPINKQSGRLYNSIQIANVSAAGSQVYDVGPNATVDRSVYRILPNGTKKMVASGIWAEIERRWKARNKAFFDWFVKRSN